MRCRCQFGRSSVTEWLRRRLRRVKEDAAEDQGGNADAPGAGQAPGAVEGWKGGADKAAAPVF